MMNTLARQPHPPVLGLAALLVVSFLGAGLSGCKDDPKAKLPGTWKVVPDPAASKPTGLADIVSAIQSSWVIELKQEGTFKLMMTTQGSVKAIEGTWSLSGQSLTLTPQRMDPALEGAMPPGHVILLTLDPGGTRLTIEGRSGKRIIFQKS